MSNAYSEQIMYDELFDSSDGWTFTGTYTFPSTNTLCVNSTSCLELGNDNGFAEKSFSCVGYHDIHFTFDVVSNGASGEFDYRISHSNGWTSSSSDYGPIPSVFYQTDGLISWNNRNYVKIRLQMNGADTAVKIYVSNLRWYGTPYSTLAPTTQPITPTTSPIIFTTGSQNPTSVPTNIPSSNPTLTPSIYPTNMPTLNPSIYPTNTPTNTFNPTAYPVTPPTNNPSINPTLAPTNNPAHTFNPTINPTLTPTNTPSGNPINVLSDDPTITPIFTYIPTKNPTIKPTYIPTNTPYEVTMTQTETVHGRNNVKGDGYEQSMNSKELIIWILIGVAALVSMGTIIGCCVVIRLFSRAKKREQSSSGHAFGEKNNKNISAMMMDSDRNRNQHIENNLSAEIEMGTASVYVDSTTMTTQQTNTKRNFVHAFSDSESRSNSDMYVHMDNMDNMSTPNNNTIGDGDIQTSVTSPGLS